MVAQQTKLLRVIARGALLLCPDCAKECMFISWGELREACPKCGCQFKAREGDTWFFMYMTIGAITGFFLIAMLLLTPVNRTLGRTFVGALGLVTYLGTQRSRKGIAIAIEHYIDSRLENPRYPNLPVTNDTE